MTIISIVIPTILLICFIYVYVRTKKSLSKSSIHNFLAGETVESSTNEIKFTANPYNTSESIFDSTNNNIIDLDKALESYEELIFNYITSERGHKIASKFNNFKGRFETIRECVQYSKGLKTEDVAYIKTLTLATLTRDIFHLKGYRTAFIYDDCIIAELYSGPSDTNPTLIERLLVQIGNTHIQKQAIDNCDIQQTLMNKTWFNHFYSKEINRTILLSDTSKILAPAQDLADRVNISYYFYRNLEGLFKDIQM